MDLTTHEVERAIARGEVDKIQEWIVGGVGINKNYGGDQTMLHMAALEGQLAVCQLLMKHKADVSARDSDGWTPLHVAAFHGHGEVAAELVSSGADVNPVNDLGYTPLHWAARCGYEEVVAVLVSSGAELNPVNDYGDTPLHRASVNDHKDVVKLLLQHGACVNKKNKFGETAYDVARSTEVRLLLKEKETNEILDLIYCNAEDHTFEETQVITPEGGEISVDGVQLIAEPDSVVNPTEITVAYIPQPLISQKVSEQFPQSLAHVHSQLLQVHLPEGQKLRKSLKVRLDVSETLQRIGDDNCKPSDGFWSIIRGDERGIMSDITKQCHVELQGHELVYSSSSFSVYIHAWTKHRKDVPDVIKFLGGASFMCMLCPVVRYSGNGLDLTLINHCPGTKCLGELQHECDNELSEELRDFGMIRITITNHSGEVMSSNEIVVSEEVCKLRGQGIHFPLVWDPAINEYEVSVERVDPNGTATKIHGCPLEVKEALVRFVQNSLQERDVNKRHESREWTMLHRAVECGHLEVVQLLISKGADVSAKNKDGMTPLHRAARNGDIELSNLLISKGADVMAADVIDWTPLHVAAGSGQWELCYVLLEKGAKLNAATRIGRTPLHVAAVFGQFKVCSLLLEKGADVHASKKKKVPTATLR